MPIDEGSKFDRRCSVIYLHIPKSLKLMALKVASVPSPLPTPPSSQNKKRVMYVVLEEGEFLYDEKTLKLYCCTVPHKHIANFDPETLKVSKKS